jgi:hypothetical protein
VVQNAKCSNYKPSSTTVQLAKEFMTDNASEAEELRQQWLAFDCVAEVRVLDELDWVSL